MNIKKGYEGGNFFTYWKKYGFTKALNKLKYNFIMLEDAESLILIQLIGYIGTMFGTIFALVFLIAFGMWYISIAIGFSLLIQYSGLKSVWQQYQQLKDIKEQFEEVEE